MMSSTAIPAPASVTLTDKQRNSFACLCRNVDSETEFVSRSAASLLTNLSPKVAQNLLTDLWQREEPRRRQWATWYAWSIWGAAGSCFLIVIGALAEGIALLIGRELPQWLHYFSWTMTIATFTCAFAAATHSPCKARRGSLTVLFQEDHHVPRLTSLFVDVLDFAGGVGGSYSVGKHPCPMARLALIKLLPRLTISDAPPLDTYQQNILRREIERYTRRLRKPTATVDEAETAFIAAVVRYLSELDAATAGSKATEQTAALVQRLSTLSLHRAETDNRRAVRTVAQECLLLLTAGRR